MDHSCCMGFDDLWCVARGRSRTPDEIERERAMTQAERNALVRTLAAEANGAIATEDRTGTDGVVYTAFWRTVPCTIDGPGTGNAAACERVLRALPAWFGIEESTLEYIRKADELPGFVARDGDEPVGYVSIRRHTQEAAEIDVMGVVPTHHRRGIGRALVEHARAWLDGEGVTLLQVKTVGPSSDSAEYAQTRRFYRGVGFLPLEEIPTLWDERNPCLIMVRPVR